MHGYGIAEHRRALSAEVFRIEEGSPYRRARYYRLTPAGRKHLGLVESGFGRLIDAITRVMKTGRRHVVTRL